MAEKELIYSYSRKQAIEDGLLVDISELELTKNAGFKVPVCLTQNVYGLCQVPEGLEGYQDFNGRLWDVLWMGILAFKSFKEDKHLVPFDVIFQVKPNEQKTVKLWLCFNEYEGFTIMLPEDY
jgi:hypothetical protein